MDEKKKFSFWVGVCFTLNYVVGSGFLTLPWAFQQTGVLLGLIVMGAFGYCSILAMLFILETMARASALLQNHAGDVEFPRIKSRTVQQANYMSVNTAIENTTDGTVEVTNDTPSRQIETTELCEIFLGTNGKRIYLLLICIYLYGTLWAFCTVFAKSFAVQFALYGEQHPDQGTSYMIYLLVFACLVVPLSVMELSEQIYVQVSLTVFRGVLLASMLITAMHAFISCDNEFGDLSSTTCRDGGEAMSLYAVHFTHLYLFLPIAAYAYIFHHSIPALAAPIQDKSSLGRLFTISVLLALVMYSLLGSVVSNYFGPHTQASSNLDWQHYEGKRNPDGSIPWYARVLSTFVVLFPAIDVASAYPLNAFTLGNNIMSAYYGEEMRHHERSRLKTSIFRLIAALPPFLGAALVSDLSHITAYTGLTGFAIAFVVPALLAYCSSERMRELGLNDVTVHSSSWTSSTAPYALGATGILLLIGVFTCQLLYGTHEA